MKIKEFFKLAVLIGALLFNVVTVTNAYDPFVKPKPKAVQSKVRDNKSIRNLPPPVPMYKTMWVLPLYNSSKFRVLGKVGNEYIVLNMDTNRIFFWRDGKVINHCIITSGEVECYVKKKVRVR